MGTDWMITFHKPRETPRDVSMLEKLYICMNTEYAWNKVYTAEWKE